MAAIGINRTLFITPQVLKDNSVFNKNIEDNLLRKGISTAEDKYIHPLLGSGLYSAITTHINNYIDSGTTIPANYKLLLDMYIVPTLIEYASVELVAYMSYKMRSKGISRQTGENTIPADLAELNYVRDNFLSSAQFYGQRLTTYLRTNTNLFPEYYSALAGDIQPAKAAYSSSIFIPGANRGSAYGRFGSCDWECGGYGMGYGINLYL